MIEMLGVLAIIGVLSVGGIAGYSKAMLKYKTNKLIDGVTMLTTNIRTLYAQQDDFTGLDVTNALDMGVVPDELDNSTYNNGTRTTAALTNPFSGTTTINTTYSVKGTAGADRAFVIGVTGIPKEACMAMATADWGSNYSSGLIGMAITNQSGVGSGVNTTGENPTEIKGDTAAALLITDGSANGIYAGVDCTTTKVATSKMGGATGTKNQNTGKYCAKDLPIKVAEAAAGCNCDGSNCSFAIKYY